MKKLVILVSNIGQGTNLEAIAKGVKLKKIKAKIAAVISDTKDSQPVKIAQKDHLAVKIIPQKQKLLPALKKLNPDYICLAGWKQIIPDEVIDTYPDRILNTHPGLIPDRLDGIVKNPDGTKALWNRGKMTNAAIQNFLDSQASYAGCSNHFLSDQFDFGKVLGRCFEKIQPKDTVGSLYQRLKVKENKLYVEVLAKLCRPLKEKMNILVIGQNGREHALAQTYARSKQVSKVVMTPGNGLTDYKNPKIKNYPDIGIMDFNKILDVCKIEKIDLVDVGQDDIIAAGYVDKFEKLGILAFGPTQKASQLEWDKKWARQFMVKYKLPIPKFKSFNDQKKAIGYINSLAEQVLFIKASGLAFGKGVIRAENKKEAINAIRQMKKFGKSGETFLIEEGLVGEEFSLFALCDGKNYQIVSFAQDHKTAFDGDLGPNTGGMGSVAPAKVITASMIRIIRAQIIQPLIDGMRKEGRPYTGVLYLGGMVTKDGVKVIEFNARWGDPEAEVILPAIKGDYLKIAEAVLSGQLKKMEIKMDNKVRISVAGCLRGYPGNYADVLGKQIFGLEKAMKVSGVIIFGSGIKKEGDKFFANGGRIFYVVGEGKDILQARKKAYQAMKLISIEGDNLHYRTDIGWRDVERMRDPERLVLSFIEGSRRVDRLSKKL